jgi:hypothetical protein
MVGLSTMHVTRLRREGAFVRLERYPSLSHAYVLEFVDSPWLNCTQASQILGARHTPSLIWPTRSAYPGTSSFGSEGVPDEQLEVVAPELQNSGKPVTAHPVPCESSPP